jgi:hypothetical protein
MDNLFTGNGAAVWEQDNMLEPDKVLVPGSDRTANLAALAMADMSNPDLLDRIQADTERIKSMQSERDIRKSLAMQEAQARVQAFVGLQAQAQSPEEQDAVAAGFSQVLAQDTAEQEKYIIEKKAVENIQDYVTSGDVNMAQQLLRSQEMGTVLDVKRDYETKYAVLRRMAEEAGVAAEDQPWFSKVSDFVLNEIITLKRSMGNVGNVDVKDSVTRWYDNFLSGGRQQAEADALVGMPLDEFMSYVTSDLMANIKENTTFLGIHNQTAELNILSNLADPKSVDISNLSDAFTNVTGAGFVGGLKVAKGVGKAGLSIPGIIIRQGGRKEIGELLGKATMDMAAEGAEAGASKNALKTDEVIDNIVPSGMAVNGADSIVSPVARVQAFIERARELAESIPELLETSRFMSPEELAAAVKKQVDQLAETAGRTLVDWRQVDTSLAGGGKTYQIEAVLGRAKPGAPPVGTPKAVAVEAPVAKPTRQILDDAGFTRSEINEWEAGSTSLKKMAQQAAEGWVYGKGGWAKATPETIGAFRKQLQEDAEALAAQKTRIEVAQKDAPDTPTVRLGDGRPQKPADILVEIAQREADLKARGKQIDRIEQRMKDLEAAGEVPVAAPGAGLELTVGTPTGLGYKTEASARRAMNKLGYDQAEIFQDESGQWFGRIRKDITEQGFYSNPLKVQVDNAAWKLLSSSNVSDKNLAGMARLAGNKKAAVFEQVIKPLADRITKPKGKSRILVEQIVVKGMNDQTWYTDDELNILSRRVMKRDMTPVERDAYYAFRELNDVEWSLRNDEVYKSKVVSGFESAEFDTSLGKVNLQDVKIDENLDNIPQQRIYDVSNGVHYTTERPMTPGELALKKGQNYVIVKLRDAQKMADNTYVQTFLVRRSDLSRRPLERTQLGYVPGGHRMYDGDHFVKQTQRAVQPDTGKELLLSPKTFVVGTRQEAKAWANGMEAARIAYKDSKGVITADELDDIFGRYKGTFPTGEQFIDDIKTGKISEKESFEAVFDRELPSAYRDVDPNAIAFAPDEPGYNGWLATTGRMYTGKKAETGLVDYMGEIAPTLDPFRAADRALSNVANILSFSDYKISSAERWSRAFKKYTDYAKRDDLTSDLAILKDAQFRADTPNNIRMAGEAQRDIIKRNIGWKSESDLIGEQSSRRMAEFVFGNEPGTLWAKAEKIVTDWWTETNPVVALRSAAFDMKLGLFNVAQLPLQVTTSFAAVALSPKFGAQGFMVYPALRTFIFNGNEAIIDHLIKSGGMKTLGYTDAASFKEMMITARKSGFFNIGGTHELIRAGGTSTAMSSFGNAVDDIRNTGRVFFHEAEMVNRSVAWNIAWQETKAALPGMSSNSPEFLRRVSLEADRYSFFMTKESEAWWQRGLLSVPTQFFGYQARMLEAMFGKSFTAKQKIRLIAQQSLMYGTAGVPFLPFITDYIKEKTGKPSDINTAFGVADRGLLDWAMYNITGADVSYGSKVGSGGWLSDTVKDMFNAGPYGEKSMAEVLGGATFGIMGQTAGIALDVFKHSVAESGGDVGGDKDPESFIKLAKQISSVSNVLKAYWIFQYGTYITTSGQVVAKDLPTGNGIAVLMGFNPAEVDNASTMIQFNKKQTEIVNDASKVVAKYRTRMISEPENRDEYAKEVSAFIRRFPPDIRQRILMKTNRDYDPSLYDGLVKQMEQRTKE